MSDFMYKKVVILLLTAMVTNLSTLIVVVGGIAIKYMMISMDPIAADMIKNLIDTTQTESINSLREVNKILNACVILSEE